MSYPSEPQPNRSSPSNPASLQDQLEHIQLLFEGGLYRQTLEVIGLALEDFPNEDELWLWQAIATEAIGDTAGAITFAEPLTDSDNPDTRQNAEYLIRIWSAPQLERSPELHPQLSGFDGLDDRATTFVASKGDRTSHARSPSSSIKPTTLASDPLKWPFMFFGISVSLLLTYWFLH